MLNVIGWQWRQCIHYCYWLCTCVIDEGDRRSSYICGLPFVGSNYGNLNLWRQWQLPMNVFFRYRPPIPGVRHSQGRPGIGVRVRVRRTPGMADPGNGGPESFFHVGDNGSCSSPSGDITGGSCVVFRLLRYSTTESTDGTYRAYVTLF